MTLVHGGAGAESQGDDLPPTRAAGRTCCPLISRVVPRGDTLRVDEGNQVFPLVVQLSAESVHGELSLRHPSKQSVPGDAEELACLLVRKQVRFLFARGAGWLHRRLG